MGVEIERRFLIEDERWRGPWRAGGGESLAIRQFYLAVRDDLSLRVRISDETSAVLTVKLGAGLARGEFEYAIPLGDARALEAGRIGIAIEKRRHRIAHEGWLVELDVYEGALAPLVVAEIELASEAEAVSLPDWLGREITGEAGFSNARLALSGAPV